MRAAEHHIHAGDRPRARALLEAILEDDAARPDAQRRAAAARRGPLQRAGLRRHRAAARGGARGRRRPGARGRDRARPHLRPLQPQRQRRRAADAHADRALALAEGADDPTLLAQALGRPRDGRLPARPRGRLGDGRPRGRARGRRSRRAAVPAAELDRRLPEAVDRPLRRGPRGADRAAAGGDRVGRRERPRLPAVLGRGARDRSPATSTRRGALADEAEVHAALAGSEFNRAWAIAQRALVMAHRGDVRGHARRRGRGGRDLRALRGRQPDAVGAPARSACSSWRPATPPRRGRRSSRPWRRSPAASRSRSCWSRAVEALIGIGELDRAEALLDALTREAQQRRALAERALPRAAAGRARRPPGRACRDRARARRARRRPPLERARTLLAQGQIARRRKQKKAARESLDAALALFEAAGAERWAQQARDDIARLGRKRQTDLTASEGRVAEPRRPGPLQQGGRPGAVRDRAHGRGAPLARLREARRALATQLAAASRARRLEV